MAFLRPLLRQIVSSDRWTHVMLAIVAGLLYAPSLRMWAYADDLIDLLWAANPSTRWDILARSAYECRPLERAVNSVNVAILGYECTLVSHLVGFLGFILCALLVFTLARRVYPKSRTAAVISAFFFATMSSNVNSVVQIDTISQNFATLFALLLLWWLITQRHRRSTVYLTAGCLFALLSLFSKETAIGVIVVMPLAGQLLTLSASGEVGRIKWRDLAVTYAAVAVVPILVYLAVRTSIGATFSLPGSKYAVTADLRVVLSNMGMLWGSLVYAGSTLDIFPSIQGGRLLVSTLFTLVLATIAAAGFLDQVAGCRSGSNLDRVRGWSFRSLGSTTLVLLSLAGLTFAGMFPVMLIGRMSELYAFGSSPYYALFMGLLLERGRRIVRLPARVFAGLFVLILVWLGAGTLEKELKAVAISDRATTYVEETLLWLDGIAGQQEVKLCWEASPYYADHGTYSGFVMPEHKVLKAVMYFAGGLRSKPVSYLDENIDRGSCDWTVTVAQGDQLRFVEHHP